jgi:serine phosphatase RsbU (regulator of sigma subunit)
MNISYAQTPIIDSLQNLLSTKKTEDSTKANVLDELCKEYIIELNNTEKASIYAGEQLKLSQKINYKKGIADGFLNYGSIYRSHGDFSMAISYQKKALDIMLEIKFTKGESDCYQAIGSSYSLQGNYSEALKYLFTAVKIKKVIHDKKGIADSYNNIGNSYKNQGNYAKGLNYNFLALKIREAIADERGIAKSYNNIGLILKRQGKFDEAMKSYNKALMLQEKLQDKKGIAGLYNNMGDIYLVQKHPKEAINAYTRSLALSQEIDDKLGTIISYSSLADMYLKQKNTKEALRYALKSFSLSKALGLKKQWVNAANAIGKSYEGEKNYLKALTYYNEMLSVAQESGYKSGIADAYSNYASVYKKTGQFEKALDYTRLHHAFKDSLLNKENYRQLTELNMQYETEKKEKEILLLTKDQELNMKIIKQQQFVRWGLIGGLLLLFISVYSISRRYFYKQKANVLLNKQKEEIQQQNMLITDSIDYAKTIQESAFPTEQKVKELFPVSFLLMKPKSIVSGDFYWIDKRKDELVCAVADCTGHGVPGAFMSLLGCNSLEQSVKKSKIIRPAVILDDLNKTLTKCFSKEAGNIMNGMDISLISIDTKTHQLQYAGAHNSLYIVRNKELIELKGDKKGIGFINEEINYRFTNQQFDLQKGDMLYLFTDGFPDQIGGPDRKKFFYKPFKDLLRSIAELPMTDQKNQLELVHQQWLCEKWEQTDDILIIGICYDAPVVPVQV